TWTGSSSSTLEATAMELTGPMKATRGVQCQTKKSVLGPFRFISTIYLTDNSHFSNSEISRRPLMANEQAPAVVSTIDVKSVLAELAVPFSPDQVQWRVTNTAKDKKRGQIVPYADPRAYADRLNALFTPQGWTRKYKIETTSN